jgi:aminopeptidase N
VRSLTHDEARARAGQVRVHDMTVDLDLTAGTERFASRTTIRFSCTDPGAGTFVDLKAAEVHTVRLGGIPVDVAGVENGRLALTAERGLTADNVLEVEASMAYSHDGQGLHRSVDPADAEAYVYGHLFLDAAPQVFACFDQPDLKAPYSVTVTAPTGWTVLGNGAATEVEPGRWELARTQPLPTYAVTVCAGPYLSVTAEHDGIPLGLHARRSLADPLHAQAEQMLEITRASFDCYHRLFGIRYPFGSYHQVFVPEFNAGAMENPGCVVLRDQYLFRGAATRQQVLSRSSTIAHEMAHMWFGDLVTMRWWDDLWLNESFAEYMAYRTLVEATEFTDAWVEFAMVRKLWGYAAERAPSTHPVAGAPAPDALTALNAFDGISYAKGAAVIRQLIAHIGDEAFVAGVAAYLREHAHGNGELAEFIAAMESASGRDLGAWTQGWLLTAGADTVAVEPGGVLARRAPRDHPADRPHTLDVAGFGGGEERFRVRVDVDRSQTEVRELAQAPESAIVVPNAGDLTWATVALSPQTRGVLVDELAAVPDPTARAVVWTALFGGVSSGDVDPRLVLDVIAAAWRRERDDAILSQVAKVALDRIIPCFLPRAEHVEATARVAGAAFALLGGAEAGSGAALVAARVQARSADDEDRLQAWAAGRGLPHGTEDDTDFRWLVVRNLAERGALDGAGIGAFETADPTLAGHLAALGARAARPDPAAKRWAWEELTTNRDLSNYEAYAIAAAFWVCPDLALVRPYVAGYADALVAMSGWMHDDALSRVATAAYPSRLVEPATAELSARALARDDLTPGVRRAVVDADHQLREALRSRERYG